MLDADAVPDVPVVDRRIAGERSPAARGNGVCRAPRPDDALGGQQLGRRRVVGVRLGDAVDPVGGLELSLGEHVAGPAVGIVPVVAEAQLREPDRQRDHVGDVAQLRRMPLHAVDELRKVADQRAAGTAGTAGLPDARCASLRMDAKVPDPLEAAVREVHHLVVAGRRRVLEHRQDRPRVLVEMHGHVVAGLAQEAAVLAEEVAPQVSQVLACQRERGIVAEEPIGVHQAVPMAKGFRYWSRPGPVRTQLGMEAASHGLPRSGR